MMNLFDEYVELLLRKHALQKDSIWAETEYIRVFGKTIMELYRMQIECVRKKKAIEFCQAARNRGQEPDEELLNEVLEEAALELWNHYQKLKNEYENAQKIVYISDEELTEIKKTYRRIAKLIHPDLHPELGNSLLDLWEQVNEAYNDNDLDELKELEVVIAAELADIYGHEADIEITDLEGKIAKQKSVIIEIISTEPYTYKALLSDRKAVKEKKASLQSEIEKYQLYSKQLEEMLETVLPEGTIIVWG